MTRDDDHRQDVPGAAASSPRTIRFDDLAGDDGVDLAPEAERPSAPPPWRRSAPVAAPVAPRSSLDEPTAPLRITGLSAPSASGPSSLAAPSGTAAGSTPPAPSSATPAPPSTAPAPTSATPAPPSTAPAPPSATPAPPSTAPPSTAPAPADPSRRTLVFDDLSSAPAAEPATPVAVPAPVRSAAPAASTLAARPRPGDARRPPVPAAPALADDDAPARERVPVARALAGAALAVSGVALGVVVLLWITDDPDRDTVADGLGTQVSQSAASPAPSAEPSPAVTTLPPATPAPAPPAPPVPPATTAPATPVVPVTVLNNSRRSGLAARAAAAFEDGGWPVAATGNFRGRIPVTTVYYDPGLHESAQALADSFDGIARVRPRFDALPARGVVVVVTREFAA